MKRWTKTEVEAWAEFNSPKADKQNKYLSEEDYEEIYYRQKGSCAICKKRAWEFDKRLAVDHDHNTGHIRGLLCTNCNVGLGHFKDNQAYLNAAIEYLKANEFSTKENHRTCN